MQKSKRWTQKGLWLVQKEADEDTYSGFYYLQKENGQILPMLVCSPCCVQWSRHFWLLRIRIPG
jgi:hypothetical protein